MIAKGTWTPSSIAPSSLMAGDVGDGIEGTGMSVGDDGATRLCLPPAARRPLTVACGTSSTSIAPAGTADVGDGISVGTGISVGDEGAEAERMADDLGLMAAGTPSGSSWRGAGEVGDGNSVGTGMSVGDDCSGTMCPDDSTADVAPTASNAGTTSGSSGAASAILRRFGAVKSAGILPSSSPSAADVGDGSSVGTGMSVGDDAAGAADFEMDMADRAAGLAGDVGDGTCVGTGNAVGEDGSAPELLM